jgi:hypothetical protein
MPVLGLAAFVSAPVHPRGYSGNGSKRGLVADLRRLSRSNAGTRTAWTAAQLHPDLRALLILRSRVLCCWLA